MTLIQSSFPGALIPNGSLELFVVFDDGKKTYLRHYHYDLKWHGPFPIMRFGKELITNISGKPAVVQNIITGDFELLLIEDGQVEHYRRINSLPDLPWHHQNTVYKSGSLRGGKKGSKKKKSPIKHGWPVPSQSSLSSELEKKQALTPDSGLSE